MEKKPKARYEPGELDEVRGRLGEIDAQEARRMAKILGGEVGRERTAGPADAPERTRGTGRGREKAGRPAKDPGKGFLPTETGKAASPAPDPDDPSRKLRPSYLQRIKIDRFATLDEFEVKSTGQFICSLFPFINHWADLINPRFTVRRMNGYYNRLSVLVGSTRTLFPRSNPRREANMEKASPYLSGILRVIRDWNIQAVGEALADLQAHPGSVTAESYAGPIKEIYRPLIVLELLDADIHIRSAYKLLYAIHHLEHPDASLEKVQGLIQDALGAYAEIRNEIGYYLYPLLMKFISERWFPYEELFRARRRRLLAFLGLSEEDRIKPEDPNLDAIIKALFRKEEAETETSESRGSGKPEEGADPEAAAEAERTAVERSLAVLESLFPRAGWDRLQEFPDLFPYFAGIYGLRRGYELIAPNDPALQVAVLMHILEDLCTALRNVPFGTVALSDSKPLSLGDAIGKIANDWRNYLDEGFIKDFLPRLSEYCRILEHSPEARNSTYARRLMDEIRWAKRLHFLPHYKFASLGPPSFKKSEIVAVYGEVRTLRRLLSIVAGNIEKWEKAGGTASKTPCKGLERPLAPYRFEVVNPVSRRMDALLPPSKRNVMHLVFFTLSAVTVLDHLINNEASWAYGKDADENQFRGVNGGPVPEFAIEEKINADQIFKETLRKQRAKKQPEEQAREESGRQG